MLGKINKYLFFALLLVFCVTFFARNNFKSINNIIPEVLKEPIQEEVANKNLIKFARDGYAYELTPLYYYNISSLLVSKKDYRFFSIHKTDSVFPVDLCLIWGDNIISKAYKDRSINFSQDCRFCYVQWRGNVKFNFKCFSNNHLLIKNKDLEKKIKRLSVGDQIRVSGKLVNVRADIVGKPELFNPEWMVWHTSTTRADTGNGACEVIFVDDVEVLKKANVVYFYLFYLSKYGLIVLVLFNIIWFFFEDKFVSLNRFS